MGELPGNVRGFGHERCQHGIRLGPETAEHGKPPTHGSEVAASLRSSVRYALKAV